MKVRNHAFWLSLAGLQSSLLFSFKIQGTAISPAKRLISDGVGDYLMAKHHH